MARRYYSRRHYQAVSPAADTQAQIIERAVQKRAGELAVQDRELRFATLTGENVDEAIRYQEERIRFHAEMLRTRPNWGKSHKDIDHLVRSNTLQVVGQEIKSQAHIAAVIRRIEETGECLWHAAAQVRGTACNCADCQRKEATR